MSREWHRTTKHTGDKVGTIMQSTRLFGAEIECVVPSNHPWALEDKIKDPSIGVGSDGSISSDRGYGVEIRTPPAGGDKGEEMIVELCKTLEECTIFANGTCGLHVHIDASDMKMKVEGGQDNYLQRYWLFYIVFDPTIRSFLSKTRLRSSFCRQMEKCFEAVRKAKGFMELHSIYHSNEARWLDPGAGTIKDPTRYRGINLLPLFSQWHAEVRYHEGTVDGVEILEWANLHCLIMDKVMDNTITMKWIEEMRDKDGLLSKTKALFDLIGLTKTSRDYFKARQSKTIIKSVFFQRFIMDRARQLTLSY